VPGLTGPLITLPNGFTPLRSSSNNSSSSSDEASTTSAVADRLTAANPDLAAVDFEYEEGHQPFADALIFEPMPYRSAAADGCTHVVTLRTRPDGSQVSCASCIAATCCCCERCSDRHLPVLAFVRDSRVLDVM
jgi:hypothetical protein